jgi:hypothetical protein
MAHRLTIDGLTPGTRYYFRAASCDPAGNAATSPSITSAPLSFTTTTQTPAPTPAVTMFPDSAQPATLESTDAKSVELGVKFYSDVPGTVTAIRFYKGGTGNSGPHTGSVWTATGTRLATVTFAGESNSGWQTALLATPVSISANVPYVVSYFAPNGRYSVTQNFFESQHTSGVLHTTSGANGLYIYRDSSAFPTKTYRSSNYFVDLVFRPAATAAYAASTTVVTGTIKAGGASRLKVDDGQFYQVASSGGPTYTAEWYATFDAIPRTAKSLTAAYAGKNSRNCTQVVSIWNWTSSRWVQLDSRSVSGESMLAGLAAPGAPADYVSGASSTGSVRVKVSCSTTGGSFTSSGDLLNLAYVE